ncbi:MAG: mechanosensitive ion channel family protein [Terracidiphilus sp.]|jgi:small-conductance mechanosensitive channel
MFLIQYLQSSWRDVLWSAGILAAAIVAALLVRLIVFTALRRLSRQRGSVLGESLVKHGQGPSLWILPLIAMLAIVPNLSLPANFKAGLEHLAGLGLIAALAWLAILFIEVTKDILTARYRVDVEDNLAARRVQTQFQMVHRMAVILVTVVAVAVGLMTFPEIKHIGVSMLASAGVASLVIGMAMKDTLANLIAGAQIAFSQPFRMGDAVVIEGEWGWIEEIGMMYVVVRCWDLRRLVLPVSYFLTNAFQNWTRSSADLLAYSYIYTDYTTPVEAVRQELKRILESTPLWSGKVCVLQVSDMDHYTLQLRALMDARNGGDAWDLRCLVREKLIEFLQKNYPGSLPRYRGEMEMTAKDGLTAGAKQTQSGDPLVAGR